MQEQLAEDEQSIPGSGATVFVVDDDASVRRGLTRLLRAMGLDVEAFDSADSFLARAPLDGPGCVLLDVQMPGMDGLELQERMARAGILLPVVFLTGKGDIPMSVHAMKQGAVDFLVKPVDETALARALDQAIRRQAAEAASRRSRDSITERLARLSAREREVLDRVLQGRLNKQIAFELGIAEKTVKAHRGRVMEKMEAATVAELVHMCDAVGIAPRVGPDLQILLDGERLQDLAALHDLDDAEAADLLGVEAVDLPSHELDAAVGHLAILGLEKPGDRLERRRLPRPVGAQERDDLAVRDLERQSLQDEDDVAVDDLDVVQRQHQTTRSPLTLALSPEAGERGRGRDVHLPIHFMSRSTDTSRTCTILPS